MWVSSRRRILQPAELAGVSGAGSVDRGWDPPEGPSSSDCASLKNKRRSGTLEATEAYAWRAAISWVHNRITEND